MEPQARRPRLRAESCPFCQQNALFCTENPRQGRQKRGCRASFSFRQTSDFKGIEWIFLPERLAAGVGILGSALRGPLRGADSEAQGPGADVASRARSTSGGLRRFRKAAHRISALTAILKS